MIKRHESAIALKGLLVFFIWQCFYINRKRAMGCWTDRSRYAGSFSQTMILGIKTSAW
jgi:hypothetical protein